MMEAIINITNKKKYWRKYYKNVRSIMDVAESILRILKILQIWQKYYRYDKKYYKNVESIINMEAADNKSSDFTSSRRIIVLLYRNGQYGRTYFVRFCPP